MKASELANRLEALVKEHGDMDVFLDVGPYDLITPGEIDVDAEDTGIIIWAEDNESFLRALRVSA